MAVERIIQGEVQRSMVFTDPQSAVQAVFSGKLQKKKKKSPVFNWLLKLLCLVHKQKLEIGLWGPRPLRYSRQRGSRRENAVAAARQSDLE